VRHLVGAAIVEGGHDLLFEQAVERIRVGRVGIVLDRRTFRPVDAGVALIEAFRASDPTQFRWKDPPYEYEYEKMPIDCLAGSSALREQIDAGVPASDIAASWHDPVEAFLKTREHVLLY